MIQKQLEAIGLSEKEAKVYLAALELGPSPVQDIARKSEVNRATTYVIIEGLMKKGVFSSFEQGKKRFFVAEGPSALKGVIRQQREELERREKQLDGMMPELKSLHNLHPTKPVVKFYEGKDSTITMNDMFLDSGVDIAYFVYPDDKMSEYYDEDYLKEVGGKRSKSKIKTKEIYTKEQEDLQVSEYLSGITERKRISQKDYPIECSVAIYDDKVMFFILEDKSGIVIENKSISETLKSLFKLGFEKK